MIKVVNIRNYSFRSGELPIPIHRPYPLGNPFPLVNVDNIIQRDECIKNYRQWFYEQIKNNDPLVMESLRFIKDNAHEYDIVLCCFCYPRACHGAVIKEYLERVM